MEFTISSKNIDYPEAVAAMEARIEPLMAGQAPEWLWFLEHPPLYTAGTSALPADLVDAQRFPTYATGRGGQWTYHGPGQRVAYLMLDLKKRAAPKEPDLRDYVRKLERWIIATLKRWNIEAYIIPGKVGVWVKDRSGREAKIAAIGIRVRKWITYHGICLNVTTDLSHYAGIVPCGITATDGSVTSLQAELGRELDLAEVKAVLTREFWTLWPQWSSETG